MRVTVMPSSDALAAVGSGEIAVSPCYRNLLTAVEYHAGRWMEASIAAAAAIPGADELSAQEWAALLDRIETALVNCIPYDLIGQSCPRLRARALQH